MAAPLGNQNAAKAKVWAAAIERAIARLGGGKDRFDDIEPTPFMKGIDALADKFVSETKAGDLGYFKELGDRVDGKAAQTLQGPDGATLVVEKIIREVIDA